MVDRGWNLFVVILFFLLAAEEGIQTLLPPFTSLLSQPIQNGSPDTTFSHNYLHPLFFSGVPHFDPTLFMLFGWVVDFHLYPSDHNPLYFVINLPVILVFFKQLFVIVSKKRFLKNIKYYFFGSYLMSFDAGELIREGNIYSQSQSSFVATGT